MENSINERIKEVVEKSGKSVRAFAESAGIAQTTLNDCVKGNTEPKFGLIDKVIQAEPDINIDWLLTGRGEMYKCKEPSHSPKLYSPNDLSHMEVREDQEPYFVNSSKVKYYEMPNGKFRMRVPLVPVRAYAKYVDECRDAEYLEELEEVEFVVDKIGLGKYYAFEIKGDSMDDDSRRSLCDKDIVLARELAREHWRNKLHNDEYPFWIIVLENTIVCKQIIDQDLERGIIKCHSLNPSPEYSDFELKLDDVCQLCNIVTRQSNQF